jgi:hypothetical protein
MVQVTILLLSITLLVKTIVPTEAQQPAAHNRSEADGFELETSPDTDPSSSQDNESVQPQKRARDVFEFVQDRAPAVRQDIYNFYNVRPPGRPNRPRPRPSYLQDYSDYDYHQQSAPYPPYGAPYGAPAQLLPPPPPSYPYYYPPSTQPSGAPSQSTDSASASTRDPTKPIGYVLMDTYRRPFRSFSRPVAFFTS